MAKKKNKRKNKSGYEQHKNLLKKQKSEFFKTLKKIAVASGAEEVLDRLPQKEYEIIWLIRFGAFRVEKSDNEENLSKKDLNIIKDFVIKHMKALSLKFIDVKQGISLYDYYKSGLTLKHYIRTLDDIKFSGAKEFKKAFQPFMDSVNEKDEPRKKMFTLALKLSWLSSNYEKGYTHITYDLVNNKSGLDYDRLLIDTSPPVLTYYNINNKERPAFKAGYVWEDGELYWHKIKASDVGYKGLMHKLELEIFIQTHALNRLYMRLDGINPHFINEHMNLSLLLNHIINYKGNILIQFKIFGCKAGWFVSEIIDGTLLIKSFLFLTNDGTPEGDKLKETAGLSKVGKQYFHIDTLNNFVNSDIEENTILKKLFLKAGCKSLFKLGSFIKANEKKINTADALLHYMNFE
jgi:hypothetical protein